MNDYEYTFGGVPCLIRTQGVPPTATMYVIKNGGRTLQAVGDKDGRSIEFPASQERDAYGRALAYLTQRFGERANAPVWPRGVTDLRIEDEPPLRDERGVRSA